MRRRLTATIAILFLISLLLLLNTSFPLTEYVQQGVQKILSGPKTLLYRTKTTVLAPKVDELQQIKNQNKALIAQIAELQRIKKDNQAFKSQFAESKDQAARLLPANVVGFEGNSIRPLKFVINKGTSDGVKQGMAVIYEKNFVGKIGRVSGNYSVVELPLSGDLSLTGITLGNDTEGVISGQHDFILFDHVLVTDMLSQNDIVVTKGSVNAGGIGVPPGLIIGKVRSVSKVDTKPFQTAEVESLLDFNTISTVFIQLP